MIEKETNEQTKASNVSQYHEVYHRGGPSKKTINLKVNLNSVSSSLKKFLTNERKENSWVNQLLQTNSWRNRNHAPAARRKNEKKETSSAQLPTPSQSRKRPQRNETLFFQDRLRRLLGGASSPCGRDTRTNRQSQTPQRRTRERSGSPQTRKARMEGELQAYDAMEIWNWMSGSKDRKVLAAGWLWSFRFVTNFQLQVSLGARTNLAQNPQAWGESIGHHAGLLNCRFSNWKGMECCSGDWFSGLVGGRWRSSDVAGPTATLGVLTPSFFHLSVRVFLVPSDLAPGFRQLPSAICSVLGSSLLEVSVSRNFEKKSLGLGFFQFFWRPSYLCHNSFVARVYYCCCFDPNDSSMWPWKCERTSLGHMYK